MNVSPLLVRAHWDSEAGVWWAESDDIPGLVTEAANWDVLVRNIIALAPDLLELNGVKGSGRELHVVAESTERIQLRA